MGWTFTSFFFQTNSFQAVLATDGTDTYVLYLYDELLRSTNAAGFVRVINIERIVL